MTIVEDFHASRDAASPAAAGRIAALLNEAQTLGSLTAAPEAQTA